MTGYPSIDKPWLKYYDEKAINAPLPKCSMYEYLYQCNKDYLDNTALNYFGKKITYKKLFENIDKVAVCLQAAGVKKGDIISVCTLTAPESVYLLYAINKVGAVSNWLGLTSPVQDLHEQLASTDSKLVFAVEMAYDLIVEAAKETKVEKIVSIPIEYSMPTLPSTCIVTADALSFLTVTFIVTPFFQKYRNFSYWRHEPPGYCPAANKTTRQYV